jgi:hypothetical protein
MDSGDALTGDERAELVRLRAEVAALRVQVRQPEATAGGGVTGRAVRQRWRTVVAALLIVLGCVLAPLAGVAVWARNQVTNTERYVATVAPLASDPAIQNAIADQITAQVFTYIDVQGLTNQALDALTERGLRPQVADQLRALSTPIANGLQSFTRTQVGRIVQSPAFADAWVQANRLAHEELVKALTGEGGGAVTVENDTVSINLAAFIQTVKQQLVAAGFTLAERIPQVNASFVLFQSKDITRVRSAFNLLTTLGNWLPVIALLLLALGVYVARDHRRALIAAGLGVAVAMLLLALGLAVFRSIYLDAVPASALPHDAAAVLYDTIVRFLRAGLRTVFVLGLVVAAGAFLTGQSVTATRTRQSLAGGIGWLQRGADGAGLRTGPVGTWVHANRRALRIGAVALAGLALVFWSRPTGKVVIGLTLVLLVVLAAIEFLARPGGGRALDHLPDLKERSPESGDDVHLGSSHTGWLGDPSGRRVHGGRPSPSRHDRLPKSGADVVEDGAAGLPGRADHPWRAPVAAPGAPGGQAVPGGGAGRVRQDDPAGPMAGYRRRPGGLGVAGRG